MQNSQGGGKRPCVDHWAEVANGIFRNPHTLVTATKAFSRLKLLTISCTEYMYMDGYSVVYIVEEPLMNCAMMVRVDETLV